MSAYRGALGQADALRRRTKQFALRVMKMGRALPRDDEDARIIRRQVLRSAMSVGANYRAACRARSHKEFVSKINIVVEEADETTFWFELLVEGGIISAKKMQSLMQEGNELLAIFSASLSTARRRA